MSVAQIGCADLDGANLFSSEDAPVYLGFFGGEFSANSVNNEFGNYGSEFSSTSVRNSFGQYGSDFSDLSAQNDFAQNPPKIIKNGNLIANLSTNFFLPDLSISLEVIDQECSFFSFNRSALYSIDGSSSSLEAKFSGTWFNPAQDGHGLSISVHSPESVSVFWYTFDPFGTAIWLYAEGSFDGNVLTTNAFFSQGMIFGDWNTEDREFFGWGTIEIEFLSCSSATMTYSSDLSYPNGETFGSGVIPLVRLASIDGLGC